MNVPDPDDGEAIRIATASVNSLTHFGATRTTNTWLNASEAVIDKTINLMCKRVGLYAIIMPSGSGKTFLCKELSTLLDVDELVSADVHGMMVNLRKEAISQTGEMAASAWKIHNEAWYGEINKTLDRMTFADNPAIVALHTFECALAIGAVPLASIVLREDIHRRWLKHRGALDTRTAMLNRNTVLTRTPDSLPRWWDCNEWERDMYVRSMCAHYTFLGMPRRWWRLEPDPGLMDGAECNGFDDCVPDWVMNGEDVPDTIATDILAKVEEYHDNGQVPEACLAAWQEKLCGFNDVEVRHDKTLKRWTQVASEIATVIRTVHISERHTMVRMIRDDDTDWFEVYPYDDKLAEKSANLRVSGLVRARRNELLARPVLVDTMCRLRGSNHNHAATVMAYLLFVVPDMEPQLQDAVFNSLFFALPTSSMEVIGKDVHELVRGTSTWFGMDLDFRSCNLLMYPHFVTGRKSGVYDVQKEIDVRTGTLLPKRAIDIDGRWSQAEFDRLLRAGIADWYSDVQSKQSYTKVNLSETFEEFFKRRREWVAGGATSIHHLSNRKIYDVFDAFELDPDATKQTLRENKRTLFERDGIYEHFVDMINSRWGYNITKSDTKHELTKLRGILPGNIYHYVMFSYVIHFVERVARMGNTMMGNEDPFAVVDALIDHAQSYFMYDFKAFNEGHETTHMQATISHIENLLSPIQNRDLEVALQWCIDSFDNMKLQIEDRQINLDHGLFSGWRITSWTNNCLNHAYKFVAITCFQRVWNEPPAMTYIGTGDDCKDDNENIVQGIRMYNVCNQIGYVSEESKQMFGKHFEFTRLLGKEGELSGSVMRALAGYVSGNWLADAEPSVAGRLLAGFEVVEGLRRRGMTSLGCRNLRSLMIDHWGRYKTDDWMSIKPCVLHGRIEDGGMGIPDADGDLYELERHLTPISSADVELRFKKDVSASSDAIRILQREMDTLGLTVEEERGVNKFARISYQNVLAAALQSAPEMQDLMERYYSQEVVIANKAKVHGKADSGLLDDFLAWSPDRRAKAGMNRMIVEANKYRELAGLLVKDGKRINIEQLIEGDWTEIYDAVFLMPLHRPHGVKVPPHIDGRAREYAIMESIGLTGTEAIHSHIQQLYADVLVSYEDRFSGLCRY